MKMDVTKDKALLAVGLKSSLMWRCSSWRGLLDMYLRMGCNCYFNM